MFSFHFITFIQQVGTEDQPFLHKAVITLHGTIDDPEIPIYGAKVGCDVYSNITNYDFTNILGIGCQTR